MFLKGENTVKNKINREDSLKHSNIYLIVGEWSHVSRELYLNRALNNISGFRYVGDPGEKRGNIGEV